MRRILFILTVAAMMVSAGPAQANETNFRNSTNVVQFGNSLVGFGDIDDDGIFGCCRHRHGIDFDSNDGIFGFGGFSGIDRDSDSGDIDIRIG